MSVVLRRIQQHLEAIYALDIEHSVENFAIDDAQLDSLVRAGLVSERVQNTQEQVLVLPKGDEVAVAVWVSDAVRSGLESGGSLQEHCHAIEGVSHFLMLSWSAQQDRQVRMLDLELQAELDKVSTVLLLDRGATGGRGARALLRRLFGAVELGAHLQPAERERYREAHRLAAAYSERLASLLDEGVDRLLEELREVYRLPAEIKRSHVARAA